MPHYSWEGRTATGSLVRGELEAASREAALESLRSQRITVTQVEEKVGARPRVREPLRDKLFTIGAVAFFAAFSVGAAYIDPVLVYDCARQANGSVDCIVHRRMYGLIPLGDLRFSRIQSVEVTSGVHSETLAERTRRLRFGSDQTSWEALLLTCADGTRWQSPESSWPLGQTLGTHREGIQELIDASEPGTYHGWTAEKVTLIIMLAFLAPIGFILLGLVLRIVTPRSFVTALEAAAARARERRQAGQP